jgi:hypothetical protein
MASYVLVVDLGDAAGAKQYMALNGLMCEFGFSLRGPETLRPAQFSVASGLPLGGIKRMVEARIRAELQPNVVVDAYEIKLLLRLGAAALIRGRRFH